MRVDRRRFVTTLATSGLVLFSGRSLLGKSVERVEFKLAKAKTWHLHDEKMAKSYDKSFKLLGVPTRMHGHDGHFDLTVECPNWKHAEFATHAEADKWEKWLQALGFETKHSH